MSRVLSREEYESMVALISKPRNSWTLPELEEAFAKGDEVHISLYSNREFIGEFMRQLKSMSSSGRASIATIDLSFCPINEDTFPDNLQCQNIILRHCCPNEQWRRTHPKVFTLPLSLQSLDLTSCSSRSSLDKLIPSLLRSLSQCPLLTRLILDETLVYPPVLQGLQCISTLEILSMRKSWFCTEKSNRGLGGFEQLMRCVAGVDAPSPWPRLRELDISGSSTISFVLYRIILLWIHSSRQNSGVSLKTLSIADTELDVTSAYLLGLLTSVLDLESIDLSSSLVTPGFVHAFICGYEDQLGSLKSLTSPQDVRAVIGLLSSGMSPHNPRMGLTGNAANTPIQALSRLKRLTLLYNPLYQVMELFGTRLVQNVRVLDLGGVRLGGSLVPLCPCIMRLPHLTTLLLANCGLDAEDCTSLMKALAESWRVSRRPARRSASPFICSAVDMVPPLAHLDLNGNSIGFKGAAMIETILTVSYTISYSLVIAGDANTNKFSYAACMH
jgi:hypothetical protein